ncbi:MAG TPA: DUF2232 domain-containing protein [Longimicrobiaceae bacterium]
MNEGAGDGRPTARWGTAACLTAAVVLLSSLETLPLVLVPLALLLLTTPSPRRWRWMLLAVAIGLLGLSVAVSPLGGLSRAWALLLGGAFALVTVWRPSLAVLPRALLAVGAAGVAAATGLVVSGQWRGVDGMVRRELVAVSERTFAAAMASSPESAWLAELADAARQVAELQAELFPGLVALQSLAALGLGAWIVGRLQPPADGRFSLRPWRDFRFNDQLVWLLIVGLALVLLPLADGFSRVGYNLIVFMTALYALRGVGVFLFVSVGASSVVMILFGALAAIFLYPLVLGAAVVVGLGDTWLDVRGRAVAATRS